MLKVDDLQSQILSALKKIIPPAIETCINAQHPVSSKIGEEEAKKFADMFDDLVSEPLATSLANAIDYYVKNASVTGQIITNGGPTTQVAIITAAPNPVSGGKIPNTFGIS